jgi:iron complex transport system ATP-binding protein
MYPRDGIVPRRARRGRLNNRKALVKKNPAQPSSRARHVVPRRPQFTTPVIRVAQLHVERDATILDGIDWTVARGQHWVILGANGSGKTSLLSTLTGYMALSGGEISVLGETYGRSDWRELRKRIGICSSAINHLMEGHETALAAAIGGRHAIVGMWGEVTDAERADALRILKQVEASTLRDRPWRFLSQGERQRVMIGRALMARPDLLILDEPCAGLDPVAREHFVQFIDRLARRRGSPTLVLVTHHVEEIMPAFTHVLVLKGGAVLAAGPKGKVLTSRVLSKAFTAAIRLRRNHGRYSLAVRRSATAII